MLFFFIYLFITPDHVTMTVFFLCEWKVWEYLYCVVRIFLFAVVILFFFVIFEWKINGIFFLLSCYWERGLCDPKQRTLIPIWLCLLFTWVSIFPAFSKSSTGGSAERSSRCCTFTFRQQGQFSSVMKYFLWYQSLSEINLWDWRQELPVTGFLGSVESWISPKMRWVQSAVALLRLMVADVSCTCVESTLLFSFSYNFRWTLIQEHDLCRF